MKSLKGGERGKQGTSNEETATRGEGDMDGTDGCPNRHENTHRARSRKHSLIKTQRSAQLGERLYSKYTQVARTSEDSESWCIDEEGVRCAGGTGRTKGEMVSTKLEER